MSLKLILIMRWQIIWICLTAITILGSSKKIQKNIKLVDFPKTPLVFLTKLHIGAGHCDIDVTYTKGGTIASQTLYNDISIGMVKASLFPEFDALMSCTQQKDIFFRVQKLNLRQESTGARHIKISDLAQQQLWYFYLFSCNFDTKQLTSNVQQIKFTFTIKNNGSHFGQNQKQLYGYLIMIVVWLLIVLKYAFPIVQAFTASSSDPDWLRISVYLGFILLGAGYIYKIIHLVIYGLDGSGIHVFVIIYLVLKNLGEGIVTTMIVSLAWGWSLIHLNSNQYYIIVGFVTAIINIVSLILSSLTQEHQQLHHLYETTPGAILLCLRLIIFFVFASGIMQSLKEAGGQVKLLIYRLGLVGGSYLLCWPLTVLLVQLIFPVYMHHQVIVFFQEMVHISACTLLCHMIAYPQSAYRRLSLHQSDNPLGMSSYKHK